MLSPRYSARLSATANCCWGRRVRRSRSVLDGLVTGMTARRDYLTGEEGRGPVHADALAAVSLARNGDVDIDAHSD